MMLKNNRLIFFLSITAIALLLAIIKFSPSSQKIYSTQEVEQIISTTYLDENGFSISGPEREYIEKCGGNPTYGEITAQSLAQLIKKLNLTKKDVLYDLGSGAGKVCIQVVLTSPAQAVGIELSETRHALADRIKKKLVEEHILTDKEKLQFIQGNITEADFNNGTVFFTCSTCFSDELMQKITQKLEQINHTIKIVSLRSLPLDKTSSITLIDTLNLPMSWSEGSSVYIYEKK